MKNFNNFSEIKSKRLNIPEYKVPSGCAVFGVINESGKNFGGNMIMDAISMMRERSNGLGGGFSAYGIYPEFKDNWAFHVIYDDIISKKETEHILKENFKILFYEEIPTRKTHFIKNAPLIYRYFLNLKDNANKAEGANDNGINNPGTIEEYIGLDNYFNTDLGAKNNMYAAERKNALKNLEEDFIVNFIMKINSHINGAYIISSGKNMGIFKGVGYPENIGEFYKIGEYRGYTWTAHGRFPTNSVGWWGGAHPFGLLDWSVVHNGEISSYGANKRYVNCYGYSCSLSTDTEVITYLFDLLVRKQKIDINIIHFILASPIWEEIEITKEPLRDFLKNIRIVYGGALINGPFSIIVGCKSFMYALNDRIKLRPLVAARKDDVLFVSSEEAAIRKVCSSPDVLWHPGGGEPVIGYLKAGLKKRNVNKKSVNIFS